MTAPAMLLRPLHVVVAVDLSEISADVLARGLELAFHEGSVVHVLHYANQIEHTPGPDGCPHCASVDGLRKLFAGSPTLPTGTAQAIEWRIAHAESGSPAEDIIAFAARVDADYIVVGTHGHHALKHLMLGSVAERVLRDAQCTVVMVRPKTHDKSERIEPPCPECLVRQVATNRAELWCERHAQHHPRAQFVVLDTKIDTDPTKPWGFDAL